MQRFRSLRRAAVVPLMALGLALLVTSAAQAAPMVDVIYDLGSSNGTSTVLLPVFGETGVLLTPENFKGQQTIRYQSDSGGNIVGGSVSLRSFHLTVYAPIYTSTPDPETNPNPEPISTSTLRLSIPGLPAAGGTLVGSIIDPQGVIATFTGTGSVYCYTACIAAGLPRTTTTGIQPFSFTQPLPTLNTSYSGALHVVTGTSTSYFTLDPGPPSDPQVNPAHFIPVTAVTMLHGKEISRTPVPEPGSLLLVGTALGSVVAAGLGRRFLRRS